MSRIFIPDIDSIIDFESFNPADSRLDDSAIVRKSNGKFALASFDYHNFGLKPSWCIWNSDEFDTAFQAFIHYDIVEKLGKKWLFDNRVVRVKN